MKSEELGPSLLRALAELPDPRSRHGRRHPLPALLALSTVAMLAGARSLYAIAHWGREQPEAVVRALGFTRGHTPGVATLHRVFKLLDVDAFEAAVAHWAQAALGGRGREGEVIALDGKALRGIHGEELPGVRVVAAYDVETGLVLARGGVRRTAPAEEAEEEELVEAKEEELVEAKVQAELSLAPRVLRRVALRGRLVTGDALYSQKPICQQIRPAQGHCLFVIKANQPELRRGDRLALRGSSRHPRPANGSPLP